MNISALRNLKRWGCNLTKMCNEMSFLLFFNLTNRMMLQEKKTLGDHFKMQCVPENKSVNFTVYFPL